MKASHGQSDSKIPSLPSISERALAAGALADVQRKMEASPKADDFARETGTAITYHEDGSWTGTVRGEENIRRAMQMQAGARKVEAERGQRIRAAQATERVVNKAGREMDYPAHLIDQVKDKAGFKPRRYYGRVKERWVVRGGEMVRVI